MKICLLANALSPHTQRWANAYAERGHEVTVLSIRVAEQPGVEGESVFLGPSNSNSRLWTFLSYLRLLITARPRLKKIDPDVVHAHFSSTHGVVAAVANCRPWVVSVWGADVIPTGGADLSWWLRLANRFVLPRADLVCSTSQFMRERVLELMPKGGRVERVPFGIDTGLFNPGSEPRLVTADAPTIGYAKGLEPEYGHETLILAMHKVGASHPGVRLLLAGKGSLEDRLMELAIALDLDRSVSFQGFLPHREIPGFLRELDIAVNCTIVPESFGVAILEASAMGLPVVASRVGGVPEVCVDNETGLLVPADDADALAEALIRLIEDRDLRDRLGTNGRRFVADTYEWESNVDEMLEHLARLADLAKK